MRTAFILLGLILGSVAQGFSQFKQGDGFYMVVNFIPRESKSKIDGFYRVSEEGKISLKFTDVQIAVDREEKDVRKDLGKAIQHYCLSKFPDRNSFPDVCLIPEAVFEQAQGGIMVTGQVLRPGIVPMKEGLTLYQAVQAAGGVTEWGSLRFVGIVRDKRTIDCDLTKKEFMKTLLKAGDVVNIANRSYVPEATY